MTRFGHGSVYSNPPLSTIWTNISVNIRIHFYKDHIAFCDRLEVFHLTHWVLKLGSLYHIMLLLLAALGQLQLPLSNWKKTLDKKSLQQIVRWRMRYALL